MLNILVCDDNADELNKNADYLDGYFKNHYINEKYKVITYTDSAILIKELSGNNALKIDIALLDICMPDVKGTELAFDIREKNPDAQIIFITTSDEYAVDAFALHAAHYLIKPYSDDKFNEALNRAMTGVLTTNPADVLLPVCGIGGSIGYVDINEIMYIESHGHSLSIHCLSKELIENRKTLTKVMEELERRVPKQFVIPYKGYIVNQKEIRMIESSRIILRNDAIVPIPRRGISKLRDSYFDFMFGERGISNDSI